MRGEAPASPLARTGPPRRSAIIIRREGGNKIETVRLAPVLFASCLVLAACDKEQPAGAALPKVDVTDPRYKGLVFLVATVRRSGSDFVITNDSTQPWFDVTLVLATGGTDEYRLQLSEVDTGQTVKASTTQFATAGGVTFDARRVMPNTLIVSAEIGEGGPTGVYAVRL